MVLFQGPYLIENTAIAPDITGSGVLVVLEGLGCCPLHWNLTSMRYVEILLVEIS